ncbi:HAMP domain-containing sensor histidine kinase [Methyloligella sp. 2.7D]|uniref:sensor histidine kinase n=1 Tax=unclassified Methyloligella TaxID=2625955 RepID=UPI00157C8DBB|nr:HAMP domain-containing sensor histidine kinase [Methyloligella sp. GL2]QKP76728.1 HAMP domain-containing protein [Methyloligella sp. GL2]
MRYQTKLVITAGLLLTMSLSAAGLAYWGVAKSHDYLTRSRIAHEELETQLQLSRHSRQLFKAWTDTLLTGTSQRPFGAAYLEKVIEADLDKLEQQSEHELQLVGEAEYDTEAEEITRLNAIKKEFQHTLDQLAEVEQLRSRGRPDIAWQRLIDLLKGGIDQKLNELVEQAVADETAEVNQIDADAARLLNRLEQISQIHAAIAIVATLALVALLLHGLRTPLAELLRGTRSLAEGDLSHRIAIRGRDEFADLGQSFNQMAADLQAHQKALESAQANLETMVAERTEELRRANESLRHIDETRRGFFADISHELRTPLTIIRGEGEIALRGKNKRIAEYKHSIDRIVEQAKHLSVLVNDLLFIARQGAGAAKINLQNLDLGELLERVCGDVEVIAKSKTVTVTFENKAKEAYVHGDPARLRQLFGVLLDNAIRYSKPRGTVKVELTKKGQTLTIRVADDGIGIAPDELESIFERFRRGGNAMQHNEEGMGLGLPLAKAIVEAHKGRIEMKSRLGKGSTVTITLPAEKAERAS